MAISQSSRIDQTDIASIYTSFNNFITNYGGTIAKLTAPAQNAVIDNTHITNLNSKIAEFRNDAYLGSKASWWTSGTAAKDGDLIKASDFNNIKTTVTNMASVKCRNRSQNSSGYHSSGYHQNEKYTDTCYYGCTDTTCRRNGSNVNFCSSACTRECTYGSNRPNVSCHYLTHEDHYCYYGSCSSGTCGETCSNGTYTDATKNNVQKQNVKKTNVAGSYSYNITCSQALFNNG